MSAAGTFRQGTGEALHGWYPYLEGYSAAFVRELLAGARGRVLDPFAGTGTTPLTAAQDGFEAFYYEVNPLLQRLVALKVEACRLEDRSSELARGFALEGSARDLEVSYAATFGASEFFDPEAFEKVLAARAVADAWLRRDPFIGRCIEVAACAALVPASRLQRAGDLRFKRGAEVPEDFATVFAEQLRVMGADLRRAPRLETAPTLVAGDARALARVEPLGLGAVVTSPPYLNGTNYFRNTKLELWFLRELRRSEDLAAFRRRAITAGICDVSRRKDARAMAADVAALVRCLEERAYDPRIPRMVAAYFSELGEVFLGLRRHLVKGALVAIDIGDSLYAGVHVPTDRLLVSMLEPAGFRFVSRTLVRARTSRDGTPLEQVVLRFEFHGRRRRLATARAPRRWERFRRELPHHAEPFSKRNWGHARHSLCSFQGKMKPSLAHFLVETFVPRGGRFLDPFGGAGTIPFEGALSGRETVAFEINPAARVIARAKLSATSPEECERTLAELARVLEEGEPSAADLEETRTFGFNGPIAAYFHPSTLREVLLARRFFLERGGSDLVLAAMLHILHGNRPYALSRRSHPITPFKPTGPTEVRALAPRLRAKVAGALEAALPSSFVAGEVFDQDATEPWPVRVEGLDAIVTSPPFFDSTRFHLANWMRLWFCGWTRADFEAEPRRFVDERQKRGFECYRPIFRQARERLKPGGFLVLHLGRSWKCDMAAELARVASPWFRVVDRFDESVRHCESHGIRDKGTVVEHQYLVLA